MGKNNGLIGQTVLGEWHVDEFIGSGGFGSVYKASRKLGNKEIYAAVKHIVIPEENEYRERLVSMRNDINATDKFFKAVFNDFIAEIETMYRLAGNSNVVTYFSHNIIEHVNPVMFEIIIGMEYLTSLPRFSSEHTITMGEVLKIGSDISAGLELCHSKDIIHRDVKEANIFVNSDGVYKLGDFGLAKVLKESSRASSRKGTEAYMAPEVSIFRKYDKTVDIYSLGIVLYRLLNHGRLPFLPPYPEEYNYKDEDDAVSRRLAGEPLPYLPGLPAKLSEVILKACVPKPEDRFQTTGELRMALQLVRSELTGEELERIVSSPAETGMTCDKSSEADKIGLSLGRQYDPDSDYEHEDLFVSRKSRKDDAGGRNLDAEDKRLWEITLKMGTVEAFKEYLASGIPVKVHEQEALEKIDGLCWLNAERLGTREAYLQYIEDDTPVKNHANEAKNRINSIEAGNKKKQKHTLPAGLKIIFFFVLLIGFSYLTYTGFKMMDKWKNDKYNDKIQWGMKLLNDRQYDKAIEAFKEANDQMPKKIDGYRDTALVYLKQMQYDQCINYIKDEIMGIIPSADEDAGLVYTLGTAYFENNDYSNAVIYFKKATELQPDNPDYFRDLAVSYARMGRLDEAEDIMRKLLVKPIYNFDDAIVSYVNGEISNARKNYDEALKNFEAYLSKTSDEEMKERCYISIAQIYRDNLKTIPDALNKEIEVLEKANTDLKAKNNLIIVELLGEAYFNKGTADPSHSADYLKKSASQFELLLSVGYDRPYLYRNIGIIYQELDEFENSENILVEMQKRYPEDFRAYMQLAFLYMDVESKKPNEVRDYSKVVDNYNLAVKYSPDGENNTELQPLKKNIDELKKKKWIP